MTKRGEGAYLRKQTKRAQRDTARRDLQKLRAELRRAKLTRAARLRKVRLSVTRGRARLRAALKAFRKEWREYVNQLAAAKRARARAGPPGG